MCAFECVCVCVCVCVWVGGGGTGVVRHLKVFHTVLIHNTSTIAKNTVIDDYEVKLTRFRVESKVDFLHKPKLVAQRIKNCQNTI